MTRFEDGRCVGPAWIVALSCAGVMSAACAVDPAGREPTALESALTGFALDLESPEVCRKIAPEAVSRAPFNSPGTRVSYTRSACFYYVARRTQTAALCSEVRQAGSDASGGRFSEESCRREVAEEPRYQANLGFDRRAVLRALGYTETDLRAAVPPSEVPEADWIPFYFEVRGTPDFERRLNAFLADP